MYSSSIPRVCHRTVLCIFCFLTLSWLTSGVLVCNFSQLQDREKPSVNITTECLPNQRCFSGRGRYGSVHVLSAQGCVASHFCGSFKIVQHRGISINVTYTCCCRDLCNQHPAPETALMRLLGVKVDLVAGATTTPNPLDLCPENSTTLALTSV